MKYETKEQIKSWVWLIIGVILLLGFFYLCFKADLVEQKKRENRKEMELAAISHNSFQEGVKQTQLDAVKSGAAKWVANTNGEPVFTWINALER